MNNNKSIEQSSIKCTRIASMLRMLSEINTSSVINANDLSDTASFLAQQLDDIASTLDKAGLANH